MEAHFRRLKRKDEVKTKLDEKMTTDEQSRNLM